MAYDGHAVTLAQALAATLGLCALAAAISIARALTRRRENALDERIADLSRASAELAGRLATMSQVFGSRQGDLARLMADRIDRSAASTGEQLARLNERLAVIDAAQARLAGLSQEMVSLKDILANKQARGAFGQGRMEAIVRDNLPSNSYIFQHTLSSGARPDCVIRLPGDERWMALDAKFPLEAFVALRDAKGEEARRGARAAVRADMGKHIKDIAERYFLPGETQDIALLFVPAESVYADLAEHFEDVMQKAHRARILIVSPSLLMMAIQVMQAIVRDARVREQAHLIQNEALRLMEDVCRLRERVGKLDQHFRQAQEDVIAVGASSDKILRRGDRIKRMDFGEGDGVKRAAE